MNVVLWLMHYLILGKYLQTATIITDI